MQTAQPMRARDLLRRPFTNSFLKHVGAGIVVGFFTGLLVGAFRWIIDHTLEVLWFIYPQMTRHPWLLIPYVLLMFLIAGLIARTIRGEELDLLGSGIPQIEAHPAWQAPDEVVGRFVAKVRRRPFGNLSRSLPGSGRALHPNGGLHWRRLFGESLPPQ